MLPDYFGLGVTGKQALRVRELVAEAAPYCPECAELLLSIDRQLAILAGEVVPMIPGSCGSCGDQK